MTPTTAVIPSDDLMDRFLIERLRGKSNKQAARDVGTTITQVKQYRDADIQAGGDFAGRWAAAVGASTATPLTQKIQDTYHTIFEAGGELERFQELLLTVPRYAHFMVERGRSVVIEVGDELGEPHDSNPEEGRFFYWDTNPDWKQTREFCMQYVHRDVTPRLGMALVEHVSKAEVNIDLAALGANLIDRIMEEGQKRLDAVEFQTVELERYAAEEQERSP